MPTPSGDPPTQLVRASAASVVDAFTLRVTAGVDAGREIVVGADGALVGSGPAAQLRLGDPTVSRRHVFVRPAPDGVHVVDHGSSNGTRVNGIGVVEARVPFGCAIVIGATTLVPTAAPTQRDAVVAIARDHLGVLRGASRAMQRLYDRIEKVAASGITVLVEGETGTGKELVAETIHELSPVASGPFVVMDCTAVPTSLMESELFGHERGAFTGANAQRRGLLEAAEGGTLFLDEIAELDVLVQPKLLRAIERREFRRIGSTTTQKSTARIVAATRRDLDAEVVAGRFRDDLFHRLAVARIVTPTLRERDSDVRLLATAFAEELAPGSELPDDVLARWEVSPWPGNVRELRNAVARWVALGEVHTDAAPRAPHDAASSVNDELALGLPYTVARDRALDRFDRAYVAAMLERHGGNVSHAARAAGIGRRYFQVIKARIDAG